MKIKIMLFTVILVNKKWNYFGEKNLILYFEKIKQKKEQFNSINKNNFRNNYVNYFKAI